MYNNNLIGQRFGKLLVIKYSGENDESGHALWICKCDCGRVKKIRGNHLVSGQVKTCGCERYKGSIGEKKFGVFLKELGYAARKEVTFKDCKSAAGSSLRFEYGVYNNLNELNCLIECQGPQHYSAVENWGGEEYLKRTQENNKAKRKWCIANNIPLLEIPYEDYELMDKDYVKELVAPFIKNRVSISIKDAIVLVE